MSWSIRITCGDYAAFMDVSKPLILRIGSLWQAGLLVGYNKFRIPDDYSDTY